MKQSEAILTIRQKENTRAILESWCGRAKMKTATGEAEYICPLCGHGSGDDATGDGLVFNPKSQNPGALRCFKCDFSGDVIDLYMQKTGENFPRAVESLARRLGVTVDRERPPAGGYAAARAEFSAITAPAPEISTDKEKAPDPEAERLKADISAARAHINDPEAREYLKTRGLGIDPAGLIFSDDYGLGFTKSWRGTTAPRLLIPTSPCSYFLRDLRAEADIPEDQKKHAKKDKGGKNLFNARALLNDEPVFICEGEIDALSIIEVGGGLQAVGLGGTSEINKLIEFLRAHDVSCPLIVSLDTDDPGKKAASRLCDELRKDGRRWILNNISGPFKDPNERLQNDRAAFTEIVKNAAEIARLIPLPLPVKEKTPTGTADTAQPVDPVPVISPAAADAPAPAPEPVADTPRPSEINPGLPPLSTGLTVLGDFVSDLSVGSWLIDRWLPAGGLSMIFGDPGAFKSFFALDITLTLASGAGSWKGNPVRRLENERPAVVYLAGEGHAALKERTLAWIKHYNETEAAAADAAGMPAQPITPADLDNVFFSQRALDLYDHKGTEAVINDIKALNRPVELILVDTLARFFHGDENSAQDAGQLIGACGQLQDIFGAAVSLIHHSGVAQENKNRSRGSSAFLGALDTQIKLELLLRPEGGGLKKIILATQTKQKNIPEAPPMWLEPEIVSLDGFVNPLTLETISTAVLVPHEKPAAENEPEKIETEKPAASDDDLLRGEW